MDIYIYIRTPPPGPRSAPCAAPRIRSGIETARIRLIDFAVLFTTFEENMCQASSVRQVVPPEVLLEISGSTKP